MDKIDYKNRIHKRRLNNILSLQELARLEFPQYLATNGYDKLTEKQQHEKFKGFFASWLGKSYDGWRQLEKGRRSISDNFTIELEDKFNLGHGMLDTENKQIVATRIYFLICFNFVNNYIKTNNIKITTDQMTLLVDEVFQKTQQNRHLSTADVRALLHPLGIS